MKWLWSLSTNGEPKQSQNKECLHISITNKFILKLKTLDSIRFNKVYTTVEVSKSVEVLERTG